MMVREPTKDTGQSIAAILGPIKHEPLFYSLGLGFRGLGFSYRNIPQVALMLGGELCCDFVG